MRVVHERCCGMDVHKRTVVASVSSRDGQQTRAFGTMTRNLLALAEWCWRQHWLTTHRHDSADGLAALTDDAVAGVCAVVFSGPQRRLL